MPESKTEKLYTPDEVAKILNVTSRAIQKYCQQGRLPGAFKLGPATSPWRIPQSALDSFLKKQRGQTAKAD